MGKLLAKLGWMVAVTIHEGPSEFAVRSIVVGAETEAEAISAVRNSKGTGIDPEDEIVLHRQLSQSEIEGMQLADGIQVIPISAHALLDRS
jgi:hypothetical protein